MSISTIIMLVLLLFGACSKTSENVYETIMDEGVIKIGTSTTSPPFSFINVKNENDGLMIDIAKQIAERMGVQAEIHGMQFSSLIPAIEADKIEMISAGMIITESRKQIIDFSDSIYTYGEGLVVLKTEENIKTLEDLKGKKVGVQQATIYLDGLKDYPEIQSQTYKSIADMVSELQNGRIEAFFGDYPIVVHMIRENPDFNIKLVDGYEPKWTGAVGVGLPKGAQELREIVNEEIKYLKDNGDLDAILKKWGLD